jgi:hypothetical protein
MFTLTVGGDVIVESEVLGVLCSSPRCNCIVTNCCYFEVLNNNRAQTHTTRLRQRESPVSKQFQLRMEYSSSCTSQLRNVF